MPDREQQTRSNTESKHSDDAEQSSARADMKGRRMSQTASNGAANGTESEARLAEAVRDGRTSLGIELGSTRIKGVLIDEHFTTIAIGEYGWENKLENGLWTYPLDDAWQGLRSVVASISDQLESRFGFGLETVGALDFSAMMHGYLAFDAEGELLVPFRTWRNTNAREAHERLSELFQVNIPERWSIAHLYQAVLDDEPHLDRIHFLTSLAGYVHWRLTGEKVAGVGDVSGLFPIDPETRRYDAKLLEQFAAIPEVAAQPWSVESLLPEPLPAGAEAGALTEEGAALLDPTGRLRPGIPIAPPEGDAGTGMVATNAVRVRTGNVSAGTSIFLMIVLDRQLQKLHPEIDLVTTPAGDLTAMVHANNFTSDLNAWAGVFGEFAAATGTRLDPSRLYATLFGAALEGDADAGGLVNYGFYSGEFLAGLDEGRPVFARTPESRFTLANFVRALLYSSFGALRIGMDVLADEEHVAVDSIVGQGGVFKTPKVAQRILADVLDTPVKVMATSGDGGAWGAAVLAHYLRHGGKPLEDFLDEEVFASVATTEESPVPAEVEGFKRFFARFRDALAVEHAAIQTLPLTGGPVVEHDVPDLNALTDPDDPVTANTANTANE